MYTIIRALDTVEQNSEWKRDKKNKKINRHHDIGLQYLQPRPPIYNLDQKKQKEKEETLCTSRQTFYPTESSWVASSSSSIASSGF